MYVINISIIPGSEYFMGDFKTLNISLEWPGLIRTAASVRFHILLPV